MGLAIVLSLVTILFVACVYFDSKGAPKRREGNDDE